MYKPEYGNPITALRLPPGMLRAARLCARRRGTSLSELMRSLLADQLQRDGIDWQAVDPTPGQKTIDEYIEA